MTDITIAQAGTWPTYRLTLTRGADPLPLAGVTATLYAIHARYSGWEIRQDLTIEDAAAGTLLCAFGPEDTVHPGTYNVQVRLFWGDGSRAVTVTGRQGTIYAKRATLSRFSSLGVLLVPSRPAATSTTLPAAGYFQMEIGPALEAEDAPRNRCGSTSGPAAC